MNAVYNDFFCWLREGTTLPIVPIVNLADRHGRVLFCTRKNNTSHNLHSSVERRCAWNCASGWPHVRLCHKMPSSPLPPHYILRTEIFTRTFMELNWNTIFWSLTVVWYALVSSELYLFMSITYLSNNNNDDDVNNNDWWVNQNKREEGCVMMILARLASMIGIVFYFFKWRCAQGMWMMTRCMYQIVD